MRPTKPTKLTLAGKPATLREPSVPLGDDLLKQLSDGGCGYAMNAVAKLVGDGDPTELLRRCWSAACDHAAQEARLRRSRAKPRPAVTYGLPRHVVSDLPRQLRRRAAQLETVHKGPYMKESFQLCEGFMWDDATPQASLIQQMPERLREYADCLERTYKYAASRLAKQEFHPATVSEFFLIRYVKRTTSFRRIPFLEIASLLDAMVELMLPPPLPGSYRTPIDADTLSKRYRRFIVSKDYRRLA